MQTSGVGRQNTVTQEHERSISVHTVSEFMLFVNLNCRTLLHMRTRPGRVCAECFLTCAQPQCFCHTLEGLVGMFMWVDPVRYL